MKNSSQSNRNAFLNFLILNSSFFLLFAGCAVGPEYKRPAVNAPQSFRGDATGLTNSLGDMPWWELFRDEALQALDSQRADQ